MAHSSELTRTTANLSGSATKTARDVAFIADVARWLQASAFRHGRGLDGEHRLRERIAAGTLDSALWLLGVTDLAPLSHAPRPYPGWDTVRVERDLARTLRDGYAASDPEWLYLGGVVDLLDFALGEEAAFWWVPLPDRTRTGPPLRDVYGREIG